jgi:N-methylhydantoinase A
MDMLGRDIVFGKKSQIRIGIDIGGTFTDLMVINLLNMEMFATKVPSTPPNLLTGIKEGLSEIMTSLDLKGEEVRLLVHGTTAALNALIERKGAKTALITTNGFIDILEIGELYRPRELLYNPFRPKEAIFVPRRYRIGAKERVNHKGQILLPIDKVDLLKKISWLDSQGIESIGICTLFSYVNPIHEIKTEQIIRKNFPHLSTTLSSRISPEMGEYKRTCTTVAESYIKPVIGRYIPEFDRSVRSFDINCPLCMMRGDGGLADLQTAVENPSTLLLSGPVGGVIAAAHVGALIERKNILTLDLGGTSCDTSIIIDGKAQEVPERQAGGMPITGPFIHIVTIGAGGGSIARVSEVGELSVGPDSAGADPGPVCYGMGGTEPTVTDANLILGLLNPDSFAKFRLSLEDARTAMKKKIAEPLNLKVEEAALAIRSIVDSKLAGAIRLVSVERGLDPGDFALLVFGAAGPLEAVSIAEELGIKEVIIPRYPGVFSALGLLLSDFKHNYLQSVYEDLKDQPCKELEAIFKKMEQKAQADLRRGQDVREQILSRSLDMRYWKQSYVLNVPLPNGSFDMETIRSAGMAFTEKHKELYGFAEDIDKIKIINARLTAVGKVSRPVMKKHCDTAKKRSNPAEAQKGMRNTFVVDQKVAIFDRAKLKPGAHLAGPAIVEAKETTIWIPPGHGGKIDIYENLLITKRLFS